jgi:dUTP pyrophosphatase
MSSVTAKIYTKRPELRPTKAHETDACYDLRADLSEICKDDDPAQIVIYPLSRMLIPTGVFIEVPVGFETQIRPRSGLSLKHGITILNSPGTIDADYRGEIKIILFNSDSTHNFIIHDLDRIAQMQITDLCPVTVVFVDKLSSTDRNDKGFGSSGVQ